MILSHRLSYPIPSFGLLLIAALPVNFFYVGFDDILRFATLEQLGEDERWLQELDSKKPLAHGKAKVVEADSYTDTFRVV